MLIFFLSFASSLVISLNAETFASSVKGRKNGSIWFVMFEESHSKSSEFVSKKFAKASDISGGTVNYGILDIAEVPEVKKQYSIQRFPYFRIYHDRGDKQYTKKFNADLFSLFAEKFIIDKTEEASIIWQKRIKKHPCAILLTTAKTPLFWKALSHQYQGSSVSFGVSSDEFVAKAFNATIPSIVFAQEEQIVVYNELVSFMDASREFSVFFYHRLHAFHVTESNHVFYNISSFDAMCLNSSKTCILVNATVITKDIEIVEKRISCENMEWFAGYLMPYDFMNSSDVWFYNGRKDSFCNTSSVSTIELFVDRIRDGTVKWIKRNILLGIEIEPEITSTPVSQSRKKNKKSKTKRQFSDL